MPNQIERLWRAAFGSNLPDSLQNPLDPLWTVTFGAGKPPADALARLSTAYGLEVAESEVAPAPKADAEPEAPRPRTRKTTPKTHTP